MKNYYVNRSEMKLTIELLNKNSVVRSLNALRNAREDLIDTIEELVEKIFSAKRNEDNELEISITNKEMKVLALI